MKVWKLVSGILSMALFIFIMFQSCAAGVVNAIEGDGTSGTVGTICGILILAGGIVSVATRKVRGNGGNIALIVLFGLAGGIGIFGHGNYTDLIIWSVWALINVVIAFIACFVGQDRGHVHISRNPDNEELLSDDENVSESEEVEAISEQSVNGKTADKQKNSYTRQAHIDNLLKRVSLFLEDGEWKKADEYCERVLDIDAENADAYLGKVMAEYKIHNREKIKNCHAFLYNSKNYRKLIRFGDASLVNQLEETNVTIRKNRAKRRKRIIIGALIAIGVILIAAVVVWWVLYGSLEREKENKLKRAETLISEGKYNEAYQLLEELGKTELIAEDRKALAFELLGTENNDCAMKMLESLRWTLTPAEEEALAVRFLYEPKKTDYMRSIIRGKINVGSTITFGRYDRDNDNSNGAEEIEWIVLKRDEEGILVVSSQILDIMAYSPNNESASWDSSEIREWLNSEFYDGAFTSTEKALIWKSFTSGDFAEKKSSSGNGGVFVFLLSKTEVEKLLSPLNHKTGLPTLHAERSEHSVSIRRGWWWLRTRGSGASVMYVDEKGKIQKEGAKTYIPGVGVRPAMWIDIR